MSRKLLLDDEFCSYAWNPPSVKNCLLTILVLVICSSLALTNSYILPPGNKTRNLKSSKEYTVCTHWAQCWQVLFDKCGRGTTISRSLGAFCPSMRYSACHIMLTNVMTWWPRICWRYIQKLQVSDCFASCWKIMKINACTSSLLFSRDDSKGCRYKITRFWLRKGSVSLNVPCAKPVQADALSVAWSAPCLKPQQVQRSAPD